MVTPLHLGKSWEIQAEIEGEGHFEGRKKTNVWDLVIPSLNFFRRKIIPKFHTFWSKSNKIVLISSQKCPSYYFFPPKRGGNLSVRFAVSALKGVVKHKEKNGVETLPRNSIAKSFQALKIIPKFHTFCANRLTKLWFAMVIFFLQSVLVVGESEAGSCLYKEYKVQLVFCFKFIFCIHFLQQPEFIVGEKFCR